jgi:hypothetical protein
MGGRWLFVLARDAVFTGNRPVAKFGLVLICISIGSLPLKTARWEGLDASDVFICYRPDSRKRRWVWR